MVEQPDATLDALVAFWPNELSVIASRTASA
jgi:hypothetical protein